MASKGLVIGGAVLGVAALLLVITNPNLTDFKAQRAAEDGLTGITCAAVETGNYVLFSRYEYRCITTSAKYVGVLGNYFRLDKDETARS